MRTGEEARPGRMAGADRAGTGADLDRGKGMEMRTETWRRRAKACEKPEEGGSAERARRGRYWRKHGGWEAPGIPPGVLPQVRDGPGRFPRGGWGVTVVLLTDMNQAFLVNDELGQGILANPHPPRLHCPTATECRVSGGSRAWGGAAPPDSG